MAAVVDQIWRFPVKSMQGERIPTAALDERGVEGDRRFGVVDTATGKVLSAKREARLLEAAACLVDGTVAVTLPDGTVLEGPGRATDTALSTWLGRSVELRQASTDEPAVYDMNVDNTDEESPLIEFPCPPGTFLDAGAVHMLTTASLRAAATEYPAGAWDVRRFRPTFLVDVEGDGWAEDAWIGQPLEVGTAQLMVFAPTVRCAVTTRPQAGLERDLGIAKTVNRVHDSNLGVYCAVVSPGQVREGDAVAPA